MPDDATNTEVRRILHQGFLAAHPEHQAAIARTRARDEEDDNELEEQETDE